MQSVSEVSCGKQFPRFLLETILEKGFNEKTLYIESCCRFGDVFSERSLRNWLSGKHIPDLRAVIAIADVLEEPKIIYERMQIEKTSLGIKNTAC